MSIALYVDAAAQLALSRKLDSLAFNLANANTPLAFSLMVSSSSRSFPRRADRMSHSPTPEPTLFR